MGAGSTTTEDFIAQARVVREALAEQGRDPATFRLAKRVYLGVDDDPDRARRRTGDALNELYGYFGMKGVERVGVTGRPGDVAAGLAQIVAAGADLILLNPLSGEAEQMERLAAEVIPRLA
jgi:alkanesulfonate monooxygenase SsuD/methylene tetrahydromethanopterin reductase-like flavin-dependent oxidoreductase (luciferase family)